MNAQHRPQRTPWECEFWTPEPIWKGQACFVLASGPSLTQEICDRIRGRKAIVINSSFHLAPWAGVWFFTDSSVYERYRQEVVAWPGEIITMSRTAKRELPDKVRRVKGEWSDGFAPLGSPIIRQGRSSGHTAISVACALGGNPIVLLGYDMKLVVDREHHHDEYVGTARDLDIYAREFVPAFKGWNASALKVGVTILNATPNSALTEFPMINLDDTHPWARSEPRRRDDAAFHLEGSPT